MVFNQLKQAAKEQAKKAADAAARTAATAADKAGEATAAGIEKAAIVARDPATHAKAKLVARGAARGAAQGAGKAAEGAGRVVKSALDKLNPATLAAIVIKATSIQEQANEALRRSKSLYRIGGIEIGAAFPPSISFQIVRAAELELEEEAMGILESQGIPSTELEAEGLGSISALEGELPDDEATEGPEDPRSADPDER